MLDRNRRVSIGYAHVSIAMAMTLVTANDGVTEIDGEDVPRKWEASRRLRAAVRLSMSDGRTLHVRGTYWSQSAVGTCNDKGWCSLFLIQQAVLLATAIRLGQIKVLDHASGNDRNISNQIESVEVVRP